MNLEYCIRSKRYVRVLLLKESKSASAEDIIRKASKEGKKTYFQFLRYRLFYNERSLWAGQLLWKDISFLKVLRSHKCHAKLLFVPVIAGFHSSSVYEIISCCFMHFLFGRRITELSKISEAL